MILNFRRGQPRALTTELHSPLPVYPTPPPALAPGKDPSTLASWPAKSAPFGRREPQSSDFHVKSPFGLRNVKNKPSPASDFLLLLQPLSLNKEIAGTSLESSQSSPLSPDWRNTKTMGRGPDRVSLGIKNSSALPGS